MKKQFLVFVSWGVLMSFTPTFGQVTIGANKIPSATLEVVGGTGNTTPDGVIMPRLTGDELKANDSGYGADQTSAMVYATAPVTSPSVKTQNVTAAGYYYFDGSIWQAAKGGGGSSATVTADNGLTNVADNIQLGGTLTKNTEINQNTYNLYTSGSGKVSIGATPTAAGAKFEVNGASANTQAYNAGSSNVIDFTQSNLAYTSANPGAFAAYGIKDGGTYTLAVKGAASGTASFAMPGMTFHYVNNGATTAGTHTLYTFVVMGSDAYVWMTKGF